MTPERKAAHDENLRNRLSAAEEAAKRAAGHIAVCGTMDSIESRALWADLWGEVALAALRRAVAEVEKARAEAQIIQGEAA